MYFTTNFHLQRLYFLLDQYLINKAYCSVNYYLIKFIYIIYFFYFIFIFLYMVYNMILHLNELMCNLIYYC